MDPDGLSAKRFAVPAKVAEHVPNAELNVVRCVLFRVLPREGRCRCVFSLKPSLETSPFPRLC